MDIAPAAEPSISNFNSNVQRNPSSIQNLSINQPAASSSSSLSLSSVSIPSSSSTSLISSPKSATMPSSTSSTSSNIYAMYQSQQQNHSSNSIKPPISSSSSYYRNSIEESEEKWKRNLRENHDFSSFSNGHKPEKSFNRKRPASNSPTSPPSPPPQQQHQQTSTAAVSSFVTARQQLATENAKRGRTQNSFNHEMSLNSTHASNGIGGGISGGQRNKNGRSKFVSPLLKGDQDDDIRVNGQFRY